MKAALVTGHRGFIGRHVISALAAAGYVVSGLDVACGDPDARDWFRHDSKHFDVVVHCAATVAGVDQRNAPGHLVNLEIDAALWQWAVRTRPGRVVYFSSSCAYPAAGPVRPLREDDIDLRNPRWPDGLYGYGKLTGEVMARTAAAEGIPVTVVRPFSVYGPPEAMRDGFAVKSFARQLAAHADPVEVWGDAGQVRDLIHVTDVAAAVLALIDAGVDGPVNLGTGRGTSLTELIAILGRAAGYQPQVKVNEGKPAGVPSLIADVTRLHEVYSPAVTLKDFAAQTLGGGA